MKSLHFWGLVLTALILISIFFNLNAPIWIGIALILGIGATKLPSKVPENLRAKSYGLNLLWVVTIAGIIIGISFAILLFIKFNWISSIIYVFLYLAHATLIDPDEKIKREASELRSLLLYCISQRTKSQITEEQLESRFQTIFKERISRDMIMFEFLNKIILDQQDLSDIEYGLYLQLLKKYIPYLDHYYSVLMKKNDPSINSIRFEFMRWSLYKMVENKLDNSNFNYSKTPQ